MSATGLRAMLGVQWRTHRRGTLIWMLALIAMMVGTAGSVAGLYPTPEKIHTYAQAATAGDALVAINGRVEGIDSLGGIIQDEFGFLAAFLLPLLGISLVAQATRREEEAGRLETVLARPRRAPRPGAGRAHARVRRHRRHHHRVRARAHRLRGTRDPVGPLRGLPRRRWPSSSPGSRRSSPRSPCTPGASTRGACSSSAVAYVLRGVGDVTKTWVTWLSPLGWAEKAAPFGGMRWWTLLIPLAVGGLLAALAVLVAGRRDLGSALIRGGAGSARATLVAAQPARARDRHPPSGDARLARGCRDPHGHDGRARPAVHRRRAGNPAMAEAIGMSGAQPEDGFVAVTQLYVAIIATGYAVQAVGSLRGEETAGRLETRLSGTLSRLRWLAAHGLVIVIGLVVIIVVSSIVLAAGDGVVDGHVGAAWLAVLGAGAAYLPAELLVGGLALALFGLRPRAFPAAWAVLRRRRLHRLPRSGTQAARVGARPRPDDSCRQPSAGHGRGAVARRPRRHRRCPLASPRRSASAVEGCRRTDCPYPEHVMDARETMNVGLGRTSLVVAASDGPGG